MQKEKKFRTNYSPEFKLSVILDMRENHLSYNETVRKYWGVTTSVECANHKNKVILWERIYLEEGELGLMKERRGRNSKGRPRKKPLDKKVEQDLIAENQRLKEENQRLEMEIEYIKKLSALVLADEQKNGKRRS